jgi:DNA repair protein RadC
MKDSKIWLVNEIEIYLNRNLETSENKKILSSEDAERILRENWSDSMNVLEEFVIILLARNNQVIGLYKVSKGGVSGTIVDAKIVFSVALKSLASGIILCHNHPSGNRNPGQSDLTLTKKIKEAGQVLDIDVLDHIILTPNNGYFSFRDEGVL